MKRRAEIARYGGVWFVDYFNLPITEENRGRRIKKRACSSPAYSEHPTHAEALAHALEAVGLAPKEEQ